MNDIGGAVVLNMQSESERLEPSAMVAWERAARLKLEQLFGSLSESPVPIGPTLEVELEESLDAEIHDLADYWKSRRTERGGA